MPTTCRRSAGSGIVAAPCPPAVKQAWIELLGPEVVWELYGGTELQALTFISGEQWLAHPGSVGVVVAGEMKVLDDDGNECPPGVVGEIYMRPAPGGRPTYRYIGSTAKSRDGWDSLGDLGYYRTGPALPLPQRPQGRHVHRGRAQRLPRRDRVRAGRASGGVVLLGSRPAGRRSRARCRTHRAGADAIWTNAAVIAFLGRPDRVLQGAALGGVHRPAAARRRRQGPPLGGARRGHRATTGSVSSLTESPASGRCPLSSGVGSVRLSQRRNAFRHGDSTSA